MKTTLELPDALVKEVKLRALHEGCKLKDDIAQLLRAGLDALPRTDIAPRQLDSPRIVTNPHTGFPSIVCAPNAPATAMSADELIAFEQQTQTQEDLERLGLSD